MLSAGFMLAAVAGLAVGQTVITVRDYDFLRTEDLIAGQFNGQTFEFGPELVIEVEAHGIVSLSLVPEVVVQGPDGWGDALDLRDITINVREDGELNLFRGFVNAEVNLYSGAVPWGFAPLAGGVVNVLGSPESNFGGYFFLNPRAGGLVQLFGGEFTRDGVSIDQLVVDELVTQSVFTATLTDGGVVALPGWTLYEPESFVFVPAPIPPRPLDTIAVTDGPATVPSVRPGQSMVVSDTGVLPEGFNVASGSLEMSGGTIGNGLTLSTSSFDMTGGDVRGWLETLGASNVTISGGTVGGIDAGWTSNIRLEGGSLGQSWLYLGNVTVVGGEFMADGTLVSDLEPHPCDDPSLAGCDCPGRVGLITAVLSDGTPLILDSFAQGRVTLEHAPVPPAEPMDLVVDAGPAPITSLREGQRLTIESGGSLPDAFTAIGGEIVVRNGEVGPGLRAANSTVIVEDGSLRSASFYLGADVTLVDGDFYDLRLFEGSRMRIEGARFDDAPQAYRAELEIVSGDFDGSLRVSEGSLSILGGSFSGDVVATQTDAVFAGGTFERGATFRGSQAVILHGSFNGGVVVSDTLLDLRGGLFTDFLSLNHDSITEIRGGEILGGVLIANTSELLLVPTLPPVAKLFGGPFFLDNEPIEGLERGGSVEIESRGGVLTGWLESGDPIRIELNPTPPEPPVYSIPFVQPLPSDYVAPESTLIVSWSSPGCSPADLAEPIGQFTQEDTRAFIDAYLAGESQADLAFPLGVIDGADVDAFIAAYLAGCP
ncbi:MAG: GC-type dockerin domain-anchored protein [Planctomycetota bacterium]